MLFRSALTACCLLAASLLAGCDMFGGSDEKIAAAREAEGRAIGGACRHAARAIEDCYAMNKKADKAAVFAGWRDMNDYMRENKIEPVSPQVPGAAAGGKVARTEKGEKPAAVEKPEKADKADGKHVADEPGPDGVIVEKKPAKATPKHE